MSHDASELGRLGWRDHRAALWWLGLLYRRPWAFHQALEAMPTKAALHTGAMLYLHALPYAFLLMVLGRLLLFGWLGMEKRTPAPDTI